MGGQLTGLNDGRANPRENDLGFRIKGKSK